MDQFKFLVYEDQSTELISDVFVTYESRFCSVDAGNLELLRVAVNFFIHQ